MKSLSAPILTLCLAAGAIAVVGCHSDNSQNSTASPYAGGNGEFGESPANPGEHSGQRFRQDAFDNGPTTQPASGDTTGSGH